MPPDSPISHEEEHRRYWAANLRIVWVLLAVWFVVSFGLAILFVEPLNRFTFLGFPLGFWIAQQGSIYCFILLVLVYVVVMDYEDRKFHVSESERP